MAKSNKKIYIGISIITVAIVAVILVYYFTIMKPAKEAGNNPDFEKQIANETVKNPVVVVGGGVSSSNSTTTQKNTIDNDTILKVTKPLTPKNDRTQWIQYYYNKYAKAKKAKGLTPVLPTIAEDGVYGNNTADAVNRLLGKKTTTWTEFKARVDYHLAQLNK